MTHQTTGAALERRSQAGALATEAPPSNPWASRGLLKPYAAGAVVEAPRADALATISAGYKNQQGYPVVSRDGTIYVSGGENAPGLVKALAERGNKSLTIALAHDDPADSFQQYFAKHSQTRLEARATADLAVVIHQRETGRKDRQGKPIYDTERETVRADEDPARFAMLVAEMKVQSSLYFALARWTNGQPELYFPDGLGLYRLRFTSLNSAESIKAQLAYVAELTGGRVAGVPLELSLVYRDVAGPDGSKRNVPIWRLVLRPPDEIALVPERVASILQRGIQQAQQLAIAAPRAESVEIAEVEGPDIDLDSVQVIEGEVVTPSAAAVARLQGGGPLRNHKLARAEYFTAVGKKSAYYRPEGYRAQLLAFTHGRTDSLSTFIETTNAREWSAWLDHVAKLVKEEAEARQELGMDAPVADPEPSKPLRSYEELFGADEDERPQERPSAPPEMPSSVTPAVHAAAVLTGAPTTAAPDPPRPTPGAALKRVQWVALYEAWKPVVRRYEPAYAFTPIEQLENGSLKQAVLDLIAAVDNARALLADVPDDEGDDAAEPEQQAAF